MQVQEFDELASWKPNVTNAVGKFFERSLMRTFPGIKSFTKIDPREETSPDFRWGDTWIEAKTALDRSDYGTRLKSKQFTYHHTFSPVVYVFGFHDFSHAMTRLTQNNLREQIEYVERHAHITRIFFVSSSAVERIWYADRLRAGKTGNWYCTVSGNTLAQIIDNAMVTRSGERVRAQEHYGIQRFVLEPAKPLGLILTPDDYERIVPRILTIDDSLFKRQRKTP